MSSENHQHSQEYLLQKIIENRNRKLQSNPVSAIENSINEKEKTVSTPISETVNKKGKKINYSVRKSLRFRPYYTSQCVDLFGRSTGVQKFFRTKIISLNQIESAISLEEDYFASDGKLNFLNKRLCNVSNPVEDSDVATKSYVESLIANLKVNQQQ